MNTDIISEKLTVMHDLGMLLPSLAVVERLSIEHCPNLFKMVVEGKPNVMPIMLDRSDFDALILFAIIGAQLAIQHLESH